MEVLNEGELHMRDWEAELNELLKHTTIRTVEVRAEVPRMRAGAIVELAI